MTMKLENQVSNKELSEILDKLGVKQESLFYWIKNFHTNDPWRIGDKVDISNNNDAISRGLEPWFVIGSSAFTVAEHGEAFPTKYITSEKREDDRWYIQFNNIEHFKEIDDDTEANARAKMRIYLIENKLI